MRLVAMARLCCAVLIMAALEIEPAEAQLRGHGGPIRALAISEDGLTALSASFDASACSLASCSSRCSACSLS